MSHPNGTQQLKDVTPEHTSTTFCHYPTCQVEVKIETPKEETSDSHAVTHTS